jgi:uncharacterized membrane protein YuzA (DUF378 family)
MIELFHVSVGLLLAFLIAAGLNGGKLTLFDFIVVPILFGAAYFLTLAH